MFSGKLYKFGMLMLPVGISNMPATAILYNHKRLIHYVLK